MEYKERTKEARELMVLSKLYGAKFTKRFLFKDNTAFKQDIIKLIGLSPRSGHNQTIIKGLINRNILIPKGTMINECGSEWPCFVVNTKQVTEEIKKNQIYQEVKVLVKKIDLLM